MSRGNFGRMRLLFVSVVVAVFGCAPGPVGPEGPPGPSGAAFESQVFCNDNKTLSGLSLTYSLTKLSDGSVQAYCEVATASAGWASSSIFGPNQEGVRTGYCSVGYDSDGAATWGFWEFRMSGSSVEATYNDEGAPSDQYKLRIPCS